MTKRTALGLSLLIVATPAGGACLWLWYTASSSGVELQARGPILVLGFVALAWVACLTGVLSRLSSGRMRSVGDMPRTGFDGSRSEAPAQESTTSQALINLSTGLAHELRNPLQVVLMGIQALRGGSPDLDETQQHVFEVIADAICDADHIIQDLLLYASVTLKLEENQHLNEMVQRSLSELEGRCQQQAVGVNCRLSPDLPPLRVDPQRLTLVLGHLCANALDAMPGGGTLELRTGIRTNGSGADQACLEILDTGAGIPDDQLRHIFEPFFTTKPPGQGEGMGLALTQRIVAAHGGQVVVANRNGGGVQATILLPIVASNHQA